MWTHSTFLHLLRSKVNVLCELPLHSLDFEVGEEEVQGVLDWGYGAFWDVVMKVCRFVLWWKMLSLMGDWVMGRIQILYFLCSILYSSNHNLLCIFLTFLIKQSKFFFLKKWQVTQIMVQSICIPMGVIQHTAVPWFFFFFFGVVDLLEIQMCKFV